MKDIGRKAGIVPDVGSLFKTKGPQQEKNKPPKTQQIFHEELMAETINCALQGGGNLRIAAD